MTGRILVVDDIAANRRLLQAKLEARYYETLLAENGAQALAIAREQRPDIILLDVMMPGMNGYEVCARLRADPTTALIPVVMVTALSDPDQRQRGLEAGADDFVSKPFQDFALFSRIESLSHFNAITHELRLRQGEESAFGVFDEVDQEILDRPSAVVVVDDDMQRAGSIVRRLSEAGLRAATLAEAGRDGDPWSAVDVIVLAMDVASFDPLRLCARLRTELHTRGIRLIAAADADNHKLAVDALRLGASDTVEAPVDVLELRARINTQTRRKRYLEILRRRVDVGMEMAVTDPLTGLHNRRYLNHQLDKWMARVNSGGATVSVVLLDIDHFKKVNDVHGHQAGDEVLRVFAARLSDSVRPSDVVCRYGGEEFAVIMPEAHADAAIGVAERIRTAVAGAPFDVSGLEKPLAVTVSAGVATTGAGEESAQSLLERADGALYDAKRRGRNQVQGLAA